VKRKNPGGQGVLQVILNEGPVEEASKQCWSFEGVTGRPWKPFEGFAKFIAEQACDTAAKRWQTCGIRLNDRPQGLLPFTERFEGISCADCTVNATDCDGIGREKAVAGIAFAMSTGAVEDQQKGVSGEAACDVRQ
jgi:hypothetical protein